MILAELDVDDVGTEKVKRFTNALDETAAGLGRLAEAGAKTSLSGLSRDAENFAVAATKVASAEAALAQQAAAKNAVMQAQAQALASAQAAAQRLAEVTGKAIAAEASLAVETQKAAEASKAKAAANATASAETTKAVSSVNRLTAATVEEAKATQSATEIVQQSMRARQQATEAATALMANFEQVMKRAMANPGDAAATEAALASLTKQVEDLNRVASGLGGTFADIAPNMTSLSQGIGDLTTRYQAHAKAIADLTRVSQPNTTVTKEQADAYQELAKDMQVFGNVTPEVQRHIDALNKTFRDGAKVDDEMRQHLVGLTQATKDSAASFAKYGSTIPPVTEETKKLKEETKDLDISLLAAVAGLAAITAGMTAYLYAAVEGAATGQRLTLSMQAVADQSGVMQGTMAAQVELLKEYNLTSDEATVAATKFAQAELNVADASKVANAARDLAAVSGKSVAEAMDIATRAIQTQQTGALRQIGITKQASLVMREYATTLNKTVEELTQTERQQAILNLVLQEGAKVMGAWEKGAGTAAQQAQILKVQQDELADSVGDALLPLYSQWLQLQIDLVQALRDMPPWVIAVATAIGTIVTALVGLAAAAAGSKLIGLTTFFRAFGAELLAVRAAMTGAEIASGTMAATLGGPVTIAIVALIALLAALAAAYIYYSGEAERARKAEEEKANEMLAGAQRVQSLRDEIERLRTAYSRSADDNRRLKEAIKELNTITKTAEYVIDQKTGAITRNSAAVRENTRLINENADAEIKRLRGAMKSTELRVIETKRQIADLDRQMEQPQLLSFDDIKTLQRTRQLLVGTLQTMQQDYANFEAQVGKHATTSVTERRAAAEKAIENATIAVQNAYRKQWSTIAATIMKEGDAGDKALIRQLAAMEATMAKATDYTAVPEGAAFERLITDVGLAYARILDKNADEAKAAAKRAQQQWQTAYDGIAQAFDMNAPGVLGKLQGIQDEWAKIPVNDFEERARFVEMFGDALLKLGTPADFAARKLKGVAEVAQRAMDTDLADWAAKLEADFSKIWEALSSSTRAIAEKLDAELVESSRQAGLQRVEVAIATAEEIRRVEQDMADDLARGYLSAEAQMERAAQRQIEDMTRATEERIRLMEVELTANERAVNEKVRLAKREADQQIEQAVRAWRIKEELALASQKLAAKTPAQELEVEERRAQLAAVHADLEKHLKSIRELRNEDFADAQAMADKQNADARAFFNEQAALLRGSLDRRTGMVKQSLQEQLNAYKGHNVALKAVAQAMVSGFTQAYKDILTGTSSLKEALVGVWNSILNAISNIFDQMVQRWVDAAMRMSTTEGNFNLGTFFTSLFKQFKGGGAAGGGGGGGAMTYAGMFNPATYAGMFSGGLAAGNTMGIGGAIPGTAATVGTVGAVAPGAAAGGGGLWAGTTMGGVMLAGAAGGLTGYGASRWLADGSYVKGTAAGIGAGAATGATIGWAGGPIGAGAGAIIGGVVGGVAGWYQVRQQRKKMEEERKEMLEKAGGEDALRVKASEAGVSEATVNALLDSNKPSEYAKAVKEVNAALLKLDKDQMIVAAGGEEQFRRMAAAAGTYGQELIDQFVAGTLSAEQMESMMGQIAKDLELVNAKEGLARTNSQMNQLSKTAALVGYDLKKLYDAKSIEEFNAEQERLNKLLQEQADRLAGLNTAAQGFAQRTAGLIQGYRKSLDDFSKGLSADQQKAWKDLTEDAEKSGKTIVQRLREASAEATGLAGGSRVGDLELTGAQGEALSKILRDVEADLQHFGGYAGAIFGGIVRETGDIGAAFEAIGGPLDEINKLVQETGAQVPYALTKLLSLRSAVQVNEDVVNSLGGIVQMLKGLGDAGQLTEGLFQSMGQDAAKQWETMKQRGVAEDQALLIMQPTLQALYEAQKNFGFATDDATANLIEMGKQQGLVGNQFQDVNQKMLDMLVIIAEAVGGTIPEGYDIQADKLRKQQEAQRAAEAAAAAAAAEQARLAEEAAAASEEQRNGYVRTQDAIEGLDPRILDDMRRQTEEAARQADNLADTNYDPLTTETGELAGHMGLVKDATEVTTGKMEELSDVQMEQLKAQLAAAEHAAGMQEGGLGKSAVVAKDKLTEINGVEMGAVTGAMSGTKDEAYRIVGGAEAATSAILAMVANTAGPLDEMGDRIDRLSLGQSPGGLKEIAIQAYAGEQAILHMTGAVEDELGALTTLASDYMMSVGDFVDAIRHTDDEIEEASGLGDLADLLSTPIIPSGPGSKSGPSPAQLIVTVQASPIKVQINSIDPSKASEVWTNYIRPQMLRDVRINNRQLGVQIGKAVRDGAGARSWRTSR